MKIGVSSFFDKKELTPIFFLAYKPSGQIDTETRYADTAGKTVLGKTQYTYDDAGNVTQIEHTNAAGTVLLNFQYKYDSGNRLTSETDTVNGTSTTTNYGYDASNQLTSAGSNDYSYDQNGNRNMSGYTDGAGNELQSDGVWNFKYDPAGNVIEKDGISNGLIWKYAWDNANHLLTATEYNASTGAVEEQETNFWDVFGNLIEQDQYNASTGTTTVTKFANQILGLSSGQQSTGGTAPVWADLNSSNQVQTRRQYLNTIDAVFARIVSDGSEAWYLNDHLGSIAGLMNNSGTLIDTITYDAWGNPTDSNAANGDRYKFAGGQCDSMTGLEEFGERWYSPADGIWISQDPLGLRPDSNPYRYVGNGPIIAIDLLGLETLKVIVRGVRKVGIPPKEREDWGVSMYLHGEFKGGKWVDVNRGATGVGSSYFSMHNYETELKKKGQIDFHVEKGQTFIVIMEKMGKPEQKKFMNDDILEVKFNFRVIEISKGDFDITAKIAGNGFQYDYKNRKKREVTVEATLALSEKVAHVDVLFGGNPSFLYEYDRDRAPKSLKLDFPKGYVPLGFKEQVLIE